MEVVKSVLQSTHVNTTTVTPMPTVCQTQRSLMRTVTNANVKMDSKVTDTSAMFTSHLSLVSCAVTMKSDKLSLTNMVPKLVYANVPMVSRTLPMVALQWDHATTITAILKQHASQ